MAAQHLTRYIGGLAADKRTRSNERRRTITNYLKQNAVDYRSHLTIDNNLKVEEKVCYLENKRNFPHKKTVGVRAERNIWRNPKAIIMLALRTVRCFLHHKGIENDQRWFFHVTAGNMKFAVNQSPNSHPFNFFVRNAAISR